MIMALVVMWFAAEPNLQPVGSINWSGILFVTSVLVIGMVILAGWGVVKARRGGTSAWSVVAALFLAPVAVIAAPVGWWLVYINSGIDSLIPSYGLQVVILLLGFTVMSIASVGGFIWLMRRIGRKPGEGAESEMTVAMIWESGASRWRLVAALALAPVVAILAGVGWWLVYINSGVHFFIPFIVQVVILLLGFTVIPVASVVGFIWLMRRVERKPSGEQGSEAEVDGCRQGSGEAGACRGE